MRKSFLGFILSASLLAFVAFGQPPSPSETPIPTPMLVSTATPAPSPSISPNDAGTVSVPSSLGSASPSPVASLVPYSGEDVAEATSSFAWSEKGAPSFTVDQAVITALKQNPQILSALEEIKRTKGVIIEIRAE